MLTRHDREVFENDGLITPDRLRALQHALRDRSLAAYEQAKRAGTDDRAAAALRGKKTAYIEAARLIESLLAGNPLPLPAWRKESRARDSGYRMRARRRAEQHEEL